MWTIVVPIAISVLSLGSGIWNFIEQRNMKKNDLLESRRRHFLDRLDSLKVDWPESSDDTGPATVAMLAGTSYLGEPSLKVISERIPSYLATNNQTLDTRPRCMTPFMRWRTCITVHLKINEIFSTIVYLRILPVGTLVAP